MINSDEEGHIRQLAREVAKAEIENYANGTQFGVVAIPYHAHTGIDSPQIDGANIVGPILARIASFTSTATPQPPANGVDLFDITALTATATFQPPIGLAFNGSLLRLRITSSNAATARALSFSTATGGYIANSPALPSATTTGKTTCLGFEYDTSNSVNKWRLIWSANS